MLEKPNGRPKITYKSQSPPKSAIKLNPPTKRNLRTWNLEELLDLKLL
jgi:hypothetical protein